MANTLCQFFYPSLYRGSTVSRIETDFRCQNKDSFEFNNHLIIILKPINLSCGKALMPNRTYLYENIYIYIYIYIYKHYDIIVLWKTTSSVININQHCEWIH